VILAEQVVVGDVVLITAGDEVPADSRIVAASALQIDESALTGESAPAAKSAQTLPDEKLEPGDQLNMAFMNTQSRTAANSAPTYLMTSGLRRRRVLAPP
jgi:P-type Ca2+ transporter type 2C